MEKRESLQQISKTITEGLQKHITETEKQCWRNDQYSCRECVQIVGIHVLTNDSNERELVGKVTGINVNQDCLESYHPLPSDKKNKILVKFSRRKDAESVLKNKNKIFSHWDINLKVFFNVSLCCHYIFLWSKCKKLSTEVWIKAFLIGSSQIIFRIEPKEAVWRISHIQGLQKLLLDNNIQSD